MFVALKGTLVDGHDYIEKAIKLQAKVIICEVFPEEKSNEVTYVQVSDANTALAIMASNYFENPSANLQLELLELTEKQLLPHYCISNLKTLVTK